MNLDMLIKVSNMLLSLQCNFNNIICDQIFGLDSDHLYLKWINSGGNILDFMTRLDDNNKVKLLLWGMNHLR